MKHVILIFGALVLSSCTLTGAGERGVRVTLGSAGDGVQEPGPHYWIPFISRVHNIDVQIQKSEIESTAATKDMQDVHAHIAINWSMTESDVVKTFKSIGDEDAVLDRILTPAVNEVMKAATSQRTAEDVLAKRMMLKSDIDKGLSDRLAQYGIKLHDVSIVNLNFSAEFTKAIESKQIAEQEAQQAKYVKDKATQDGLALVETARGQSQAQMLLKSSITAEILQQRAIEKWDGHFPQVMSSAGSLPFINVKMKE